MKIDIATLCNMVENIIPGTKTVAHFGYNQITVSFDNRPDVKISLLTPYLQNQMKKGEIDDTDIAEMLNDVKRICR